MSRPVASTAIAPFNLPLNAKQIVAERLWSGIHSSSGWLRHLRLWPFRRVLCFLTLTGVAQAAQYPCRVTSPRLCGERGLFDSTRPETAYQILAQLGCDQSSRQLLTVRCPSWRSVPSNYNQLPLAARRSRQRPRLLLIGAEPETGPPIGSGGLTA